MLSFDLYNVTILDGFLKKKMEINESVSLLSVYNQFKDNRFVAIKCNIDDKDRHIFYDSDIAKWLEAVGYSLIRKEDKNLRNIANETIDTICKNQLENGYFNSFYQVENPDGIFKDRLNHELYCAGHLFEAAYSWKKYQNDNRLLNFSSKFVDYIILRFIKNKDTAFLTPGHEEVELALLRLYDLTKEKKYLKLSQFFLNTRGLNTEPTYNNRDLAYDQSHLPIRDQLTAEGHSVRAMYLYIAMAKLLLIKKDKKIENAINHIFYDIIDKKMYITGGLGSTRFGERFTVEYDLPNDTAYAETCASISLAFLCHELMLNKPKAIYGDTFERVFYNGLLSGVSKDGKAFFYINPLEVNIEKTRYARAMEDAESLPIVERKEVFWCSCCPPNINRFLERAPEFIYYKKDGCLYINQYFSSELNTNDLKITMNSGFPYEGSVKIKVSSKRVINLMLRIPYWCSKYSLNRSYKVKKGFILLENLTNEEVELNFLMELRRVYCNSEVRANNHKFALMYGPLVMAMEGCDNNFSIASFAPNDLSHFEMVKDDIFKIKIKGNIYKSKKLYSFSKPTKETIEGTLIPYFEWANRGENDMKVFF